MIQLAADPVMSHAFYDLLDLPEYPRLLFALGQCLSFFLATSDNYPPATGLFEMKKVKQSSRVAGGGGVMSANSEGKLKECVCLLGFKNSQAKRADNGTTAPDGT